MGHTIRIPVYRQPPAWLLAGVVVAAVLPVALNVAGFEIGPRIHVGSVFQALPTASTVVTPAMVATTTPPQPAALAPANEPAALVLESTTETEPAADPSFESALAIAPSGPVEAAPAAKPESDKPARSTTQKRSKSDGNGYLAQAKAACRQGDKEAARAIVRELPVGDARRREIRKTCRAQGVRVL